MWLTSVMVDILEFAENDEIVEIVESARCYHETIVYCDDQSSANPGARVGLSSLK